MRFIRTATLSIMTLTACEPAEAPRQTFVVTDSSGVRVVTSLAPTWVGESPWSVSRVPTLSIGTDPSGDAALFTFVQAAEVLEDGSVVVLDGLSRELRFFDSKGGHTATLGGEGSGPGEFRSPRGMSRLADTLVVFDRAALTISRFLTDATFLESKSASVIPLGAVMDIGGWTMALGDGTLVAEQYQPGRRPAEREIDRLPLALVLGHLENRLLDTLDTYPGQAWFLIPEVRRDAFLPRYQTVYSAIPSGPGIAVGDTETGKIDLFTSYGTHLLRIQYPSAVRAATREQVARERSASLAWATDRARSRPRFNLEAYRRWIDELPDAETWPAFRSLLVDPLGYVWALPYRPGEGVAGTDIGSQPTLVFHPDGHLLGTVQLPSDLDPLQIGRDRIVGRTIDDLDVHRVVVYGLSR